MTVVARATCGALVMGALRAPPAAAQRTQTPVPQVVAAPPAIACADVADADSGTQREICLTVPAGADGPALALPVVVVRGPAPGPTLVVTAGVHGAEYALIVAAQRVRARSAAGPRLAARLRGRPVLVLFADPPAFWRCSVYHVPADGRNLNRVFPGRADGTQSERLAWVLAERALRTPGGAWADAYVDLHAGDANEALVPRVVRRRHGRPGVRRARGGPRRRAPAALARDPRPYQFGRTLYWAGAVRAALDDSAAAVAALREAFARGQPYGAYLHAAPEWEALHGYAPFEQLIRPAR
jgi:hypothetical protein